MDFKRTASILAAFPRPKHAECAPSRLAVFYHNADAQLTRLLFGQFRRTAVAATVQHADTDCPATFCAPVPFAQPAADADARGYKGGRAHGEHVR